MVHWNFPDDMTAPKTVEKDDDVKLDIIQIGIENSHFGESFSVSHLDVTKNDLNLRVFVDKNGKKVLDIEIPIG